MLIELFVEVYKEFYKLVGKWMDILDFKDFMLIWFKGVMINYVY